MKAIYLDMDGTIVNLYGVTNWDKLLDAHDPTPYKTAKPLVNLCLLAKLLNLKQKNGWTIGIVSWLSKSGDKEYNTTVKSIKENWLKKHLKSVSFDEIHIVNYGTPKEEITKYPNGILFDDNEENRNSWKGTAYDEKDLIAKLKTIG